MRMFIRGRKCAFSPLILPFGGGGAQRRRGYRQQALNLINDAIHLAVDLEIPEAKYREAFCDEMCITNGVPLGNLAVTMLRTIHFDDELGIEFSEVENIAVGRGLPAKVKAASVKVFELNPQFHFFVGHVFS